MVFDLVAADMSATRLRWLYRSDDHSAFAYAHGTDFIRYRDHTLWAHLSFGQLFSARSGDCLAYRIGSIFYNAMTHEPVYYESSKIALPNTPVRGETCGAGNATTRARTALRISHRGRPSPGRTLQRGDVIPEACLLRTKEER